jgi:hypothetical protein
MLKQDWDVAHFNLNRNCFGLGGIKYNEIGRLLLDESVIASEEW